MNNSTNSRIAAETSVHELALVFLRHFESRSGLRCRESVVQALKLWSKENERHYQSVHIFPLHNKYFTTENSLYLNYTYTLYSAYVIPERWVPGRYKSSSQRPEFLTSLRAVTRACATESAITSSHFGYSARKNHLYIQSMGRMSWGALENRNTELGMASHTSWQSLHLELCKARWTR